MPSSKHKFENTHGQQEEFDVVRNSLIARIGIRKAFRLKRGACSRDRFNSSNEERSPVVSSTITDESQSNLGSSQPQKSSVPWFPGILPANIRSLRYKMDEVQAVVAINLPGIVSLFETWLNSSIGDSIISLSGYCSYRCDRAVGWGGVCVYVNSQIPCKSILSHKSEVESLWLEIRPFCLSRRLFLTFYWVLLTHYPNNCQELSFTRSNYYDGKAGMWNNVDK